MLLHLPKLMLSGSNRKLFLDKVLPKVIIMVQSHSTKNKLQSSQSVVMNLKAVFLALFLTV